MIGSIKLYSFILGLNWKLVASICTVESGLQNIDNLKDGGSASYGVCQIKANTAKFIINKYNLPISTKNLDDTLRNIHYNIILASYYIKWQTGRYGKDIDCIIKAYNSGTCIKNRSNGYLRKVKKHIRRLDGK